jgi:hypothetical protein
VANQDAIPWIQSLHIENSRHMPSDHAPLEIVLETANMKKSLTEVAKRAADLGAQHLPRQGDQTKGPALHRVDEEAFKRIINRTPAPVIDETMIDIDASVIDLNSTLNAAARQAKKRPQRTETWGTQQERWERLIQTRDPRRIWRAIGWNGQLQDGIDETPSDDRFKEHFESLLCGQGEQTTVDLSEAPYIPALDDAFRRDEALYKSQRTSHFQEYVQEFSDGCLGTGWCTYCNCSTSSFSQHHIPSYGR